jgi:hypothetical protein
MVPGGQVIYVAHDGTVSYTGPHSVSLPPKSILGGFFNKIVLSDCQRPVEVLDFSTTEPMLDNGVFACASNLSWVNDAYVLVANTTGFKYTDCVRLDGIRRIASKYEIGAYQY